MVVVVDDIEGLFLPFACTNVNRTAKTRIARMDLGANIASVENMVQYESIEAAGNK